jgi:hypothetical protein
MDILEKWLNTHSSLDTDDIPLYDIVAEEIEAGVLHKGTWAKAFAEANADKDKARAIYLKLRVAQLPTEIAAFQAAAAESNRPFLNRLQDLARGSLPDMDHVESAKFEGNLSSISQPIPISEVADITGLLDFQIIDLIKVGRLRGVRCGEDWFVDGTYIGEEEGG